ncbi:TspO/MBR family protein [Spirosoma soli]|uniref:TspO/MBR family protein n=1 Tax=Spirosoma soli TaxID=1770529 RepID=A0ABW5ME28_9BACT
MNVTHAIQARFSWLPYVLFCLIVGQLTAYLGNEYFGHDWDKNLIKPSVTQFNWLFFVAVWTVNYTTMGVAAWYVRRTGSNALTKRALGWFWFQFGLCLLWIPIVHGTGWVGTAVTMDFVVGIPAFITGYWFYKASRRAFNWYVPYLLWTLITTHAKIWMYMVNT